jgi:hypothetical protein
MKKGTGQIIDQTKSNYSISSYSLPAKALVSQALVGFPYATLKLTLPGIKAG